MTVIVGWCFLKSSPAGGGKPLTPAASERRRSNLRERQAIRNHEPQFTGAQPRRPQRGFGEGSGPTPTRLLRAANRSQRNKLGELSPSVRRGAALRARRRRAPGKAEGAQPRGGAGDAKPGSASPPPISAPLRTPPRSRTRHPLCRPWPGERAGGGRSILRQDGRGEQPLSFSRRLLTLPSPSPPPPPLPSPPPPPAPGREFASARRPQECQEAARCKTTPRPSGRGCGAAVPARPRAPGAPRLPTGRGRPRRIPGIAGHNRTFQRRWGPATCPARSSRCPPRALVWAWACSCPSSASGGNVGPTPRVGTGM